MEVAEATADITAATTTAVSGAASPRPSGMRRSAISSSEPLRKKTRAPRTSAGTMSRARTRTGQTSAESRPNAPAPQAAVKAVLVMVSPSSDWSRKSGRMPASASRVRADAAQTAITRIKVAPALRHFPSATPSTCAFPSPGPVVRARPSAWHSGGHGRRRPGDAPGSARRYGGRIGSYGQRPRTRVALTWRAPAHGTTCPESRCTQRRTTGYRGTRARVTAGRWANGIKAGRHGGPLDGRGDEETRRRWRSPGGVMPPARSRTRGCGS